MQKERAGANMRGAVQAMGVGVNTGVSLEAEHADDAVYYVVCQFKIALSIGDGAMFE